MLTCSHNKSEPSKIALSLIYFPPSSPHVNKILIIISSYMHYIVILSPLIVNDKLIFSFLMCSVLCLSCDLCAHVQYVLSLYDFRAHGVLSN